MKHFSLWGERHQASQSPKSLPGFSSQEEEKDPWLTPQTKHGNKLFYTVTIRFHIASILDTQLGNGYCSIRPFIRLVFMLLVSVFLPRIVRAEPKPHPGPKSLRNPSRISSRSRKSRFLEGYSFAKQGPVDLTQHLQPPASLKF